MRTYLFHGPSGCGKDTQVARLKGFEIIGTGDMFRRMYEDGDQDGIEAHKYWSVGKLVPDELVYKMLGRWLESFDKNKDWAFVSVVRAYNQIELFEKMLAEKGRKLDAFIHFELSEEVAIERMSNRLFCKKCGATYHTIHKPPIKEGLCDNDGETLIRREDDQPEKIKNRLEEYKKEIESIKKYYKDNNLLVEIDANRSIDEIAKDLVAYIVAK